MPKMKTRSAAAKRFKKTGSGKIMRMKANKSHILNSKIRFHINNYRFPDRANHRHYDIAYIYF